MKNIIQIIPMLACMLCLALTVQAEEWVNLFNGKDLSGWQTTGNWKVEEDGVLSLTPRPGEEGWQRYDAYLTRKSNSGIISSIWNSGFLPKSSGVFD